MRSPVGVRVAGRRRLAQAGAWVNLPALAAVVIWSGVYPFSKYALGEFPLFSYVALRPLIASTMVFGFLTVRRQPVRIARQDRPRLLLAALAGMVTFQLFFIFGLKYTSASHSALLNASSPLLGAAVLQLAGRYRPDRRSALGLVAGFAGVVILLSGAHGAGDAALTGDLLTLVSALGWVVVSTVPRPLVARYGPVRVAGWMILCAAVITLPLGLSVLGELVAQPPSLLAWGALIYSSVLGMFMANVLWQRAVHHLGSTQTMAYLYLQPFLALLLSAALLGERLTPPQALGGLIALAGVGLVRR
ncbi:MAG TPA: DMT family transporter [Thermomicrobiaceae bacterium]|nr:DMT family transporter [Thermomicrobiaceae bacterium]